jgi:hypothetical protein
MLIAAVILFILLAVIPVIVARFDKQHRPAPQTTNSPQPAK